MINCYRKVFTPLDFTVQQLKRDLAVPTVKPYKDERLSSQSDTTGFKRH